MATNITGRTRLFIIIADPVHHVRTPEVFNQRLNESSVDGVLVAVHVGADGLAAFVDGAKQIRNLAGLIVTVPHKKSMAALCDELEPRAKLAGSVNTVRIENGRLIGENFDGKGFVQGLAQQGYSPAGKHALLLGSGGAASAIAFALAEAGIRQLTISNRDISKAEHLAVMVEAAFPVVVGATNSPDTEQIDLIVNATSLGMHAGDPLPLESQYILPRHMVAEVVMFPEVTSFLTAARSQGASIHLGKHMLDAQMTEMGRFLHAF